MGHRWTRIIRKWCYEREGGECFYCGFSLLLDVPHLSGVKQPRIQATIDHITPKSVGGRTTMENCVLSCSSCNTDRGVFDAHLFLYWRMNYERWRKPFLWFLKRQDELFVVDTMER